MWTRIVPAAFALAILLLSTPASHAQIARLWNTGDGDWSNPINWLPNGVPGTNDGAVIGASAAAENDWVTLDQNDTVAGLTITDGMTLRTDGHRLIVQGETSLSGRNSTEGNFTHPSSIVVDRGMSINDFDTDDLTVANQASVRLRDGGILEVDQRFTIDDVSSMHGDGVVRFTGGGEVFQNDNLVQAGVGGTVFNVTGGGSLDLDGAIGDGRYNVTGAMIDGSDFASLTINGGTVSDPFGGQIWIGDNNFLAMNVDAPWVADATSEIRLFGGEHGDAVLSGADVTLGGELRMSGGFSSSTRGRIDANATFAATADVSIGEDDDLEMTGEADIEGGVFQLDEGASIIFSGPTTLRGGTFDKSQSSAFDSGVILDGPTTYRGTVNFNGFARQLGDATVAASTTINATSFDMDGAVPDLVAWDFNAPAIINADRIEGGIASNPTFRGELNFSGITGRLTINLTDPDEAWVMDGTLNLSGNAIFNLDRIAGSAMEARGDVNVSSSQVGILADTEFTSSSTLDFAGANSRLLMKGDSHFDGGMAISGPGTLANHTTGHMRLGDGLTLGDVDLENRGVLELGNSPGLVSLDNFENTNSGTFLVEIGGFAAGSEHDLLAANGVATLAGEIDVLLINAGAGLLLPELGDGFTVLTAVGGVDGAFAITPITNVGGELYEWDVEHNANNVTVRLASVSGLLGDYNSDGIVDAADYTVWLDTLGEDALLAADGNQDGLVNQADYEVWSDNFGATAGGAGAGATQNAMAAIPEPGTVSLLALVAITASLVRRRQTR